MNPLQRAVFRRKLWYFAAILGLFTVSMFWRGVIPIPLSSTARAAEAPSAAHRAADRVASRTILNQAVRLELRELEEGEQELSGSAQRLALVGSRGLVVAYLWHSAIDAQRRNDFHRMDSLVQEVTRLQPHFITPWIFQSWNIAYNVSVEMQGSGDMYFYIARGIDLLAEGERRQGRVDADGRRLGSPDMRYQIGFYYQNKFGVSDNVEVLRCLFQLSCISPDDRNPDDLEERDERGERVVNTEKFRQFCEKYPHLVRRLRGEDQVTQSADEATQRRVQEALKCPRPQDIIQFLRDNKEVPGRYKSAKELAEANRQFPILPPQFGGGQEYDPRSQTKDDFSGYLAARAWFAYGMVPLPPNPVDWNNRPLPWRTPQPGEYDPVRYRVPRQPMLIIFRQGAVRAQSFQAEMEQKEGWFDDEGWRIDDPSTPRANRWFPDREVIVGRERPWSLDEWQKAAAMWRQHGGEYGLDVGVLDRGYAAVAASPPPGAVADPAPELLADPAFRGSAAGRWFLAVSAVGQGGQGGYFAQNRQVTNFPYFLASSEGEARPATVKARKTLWKAEQVRRRAEPFEAIALYRDGLDQWKRVLASDKNFHRYGGDRTEEETYSYDLAYQRLLVQYESPAWPRAEELARQVNRVFPVLPFPAMAVSLMKPAAPADPKPKPLESVLVEFRWYVAEKELSPFGRPMGEQDGVTDERRGEPWVRNQIKDTVRTQQGVQRRTTEAEQPQAKQP